MIRFTHKRGDGGGQEPFLAVRCCRGRAGSPRLCVPGLPSLAPALERGTEACPSLACGTAAGVP